jgi:putative DNA primase/helicase
MSLTIVGWRASGNASRQAALSYAILGWWLIPLHTSSLARCSCGCLDCAARGHHPRTDAGLCEASRDLQTIQLWWSLWHDANVGLVLRPSNLLALELDEQNVRLAGYHNQMLPRTPQVSIPDGPAVLLYHRPPGMPVRTIELATGMTLWADGFIILPPSKVDVTYDWAPKAGPETQIAPLPDWIVLQLLTGRAPKWASPDRAEAQRQHRRNSRSG